MANHDANPALARAEQKRKRQERAARSGDLTAARRKLWDAIGRVDEIVHDADASNAEVIKATHCLSQTVSVFVRLVEGAELEARLAEVEAALAARPDLRRVG